MMKAFSLLSAPLLLVAFAAPSLGEKMTTQASDGRGCEVRATNVSGGVQLQAIAFADSAASGEYEFVVKKSGGGGTSNTSQGGDFEVGAGAENVLSEVTFGGDSGSIAADLTVSWSGGGTTCKASYPKRA